jgi:hypothetical protein
MCDELLDETLFHNLDRARAALARWALPLTSSVPTQLSAISLLRLSREL